MICVSLPVHEQPEVIKNQIENINKYFTSPHIVLHVSLVGFALKDALRRITKDYSNVLINPASNPTEWGWMFHAHLSNYRWIRRIGVKFDYFLLESSNTLYIKRVDESRLSAVDFLATLEDLDIVSSARWGWKDRLAQDSCFAAIKRDFKIKSTQVSFCEGTAYRADLIEQMVQIVDEYYHMDFDEVRYPREEIYFGTLARHFSNRFDASLTALLWGEGDLDRKKEAIQKMRCVEKECCAVKPVPRQPDHPLRKYINALP